MTTRLAMQSFRLSTLMLFLLVSLAPSAADAQRVRSTSANGKTRQARSVPSTKAKATGRQKGKVVSKLRLRPAKTATSALQTRVATRDTAKFNRAFGFAAKIGNLRTEMGGRMGAFAKAPKNKPTLELGQAAIFTIMDKKYVRIGSERYASRETSPSFGASSLRKKHVKVKGDLVHFDFPGKTGEKGKKVQWTFTIKDRNLALTIQAFQRLPGPRLFQYPRGSKLTPVSAISLRSVFKAKGALPKDLRTIGANREYRLAIKQLEAKAPSKTKSDRAAHSKAAKTIAAAKLHHTPSMHESNYLDPKVEQQYLQSGKTARGPP